MKKNNTNFSGKIWLMSFAIGLGVITTGCKKDDEETTTPATGLDAVDAEFVNKSTLANLAEIQLGNLANTKAADADIKEFGHMMVMDHTTQSNEVKQIADKRNIQLPVDLDAAHKQIKSQLEALSGTKFDSAYIKGQVDDHKATRMLFEKEITDGKDTELKQLAAKNLPKIIEHQQRAEVLYKDFQ